MAFELNHQNLGILIKFVGTWISATADNSNNVFNEVLSWALDPRQLDLVVDFYKKHNYNTSDLTTESLTKLAAWAGFRTKYPTPLRNFAEIEEVLTQYEQGIVHKNEILLACQLTPHQVAAVNQWMKLPRKVAEAHSMSDWDDHVQLCTERGDTP